MPLVRGAPPGLTGVTLRTLGCMATKNRARSDVAKARQAANRATKLGQGAPADDSVKDVSSYAPDDEVLASADRIAQRDSELLRRLAQ